MTSTSISETLGVQRSFGRDAAAFIAEWLSLVTARGIAGVPALLAVDEGGRRLVRRFIPGSPLADLLRDGRNPGDADGALSRLEHLIEALHRVGITGFGISPDDVVIDRLGAPWLVNFRHAQVHRSTETLAFVFARDNDRVAFNRLYRRNLLTEAGARLALAQTGATLPWGWYAAIDFGHGLAVSGVSGIWSTDIGVGRWEFFNRHVVAPLVRGGRVLDLGSNNGLLPMMMLRAGAREVLGVEVSKPYVKAAELVRRVFEWRDMRPYALRIHHGTMLDTLNHDWGTFDVATAFCSLYYLSAEEMAAVVRRAAQIAPVMVLQANEGMPGNSPDNRAERATAVYLHRLLQQNGLPRTRIHAPSGYARPLVVGRRTEGA